jgi:diaphanous 1
MNSSKLNQVLEAILALGNFLNSGTGRGGAHGFKLEALAMLSSVKDSKGDTLLDYIVRYHLKNKPGVLPMTDMPTLHRSADLSLEGMAESVQHLIDNVTNATAQVGAIGTDPSLANFKKEMETFAGDAVKVKDEVVALKNVMLENLQLLMGHFGERNKAARGRQEDTMRMLREFNAEIEAVLKKEADKKAVKAKKGAK